MTDFTTNIDMNVRMMNEKLRVDRRYCMISVLRYRKERLRQS